MTLFELINVSSKMKHSQNMTYEDSLMEAKINTITKSRCISKRSV